MKPNLIGMRPGRRMAAVIASALCLALGMASGAARAATLAGWKSLYAATETLAGRDSTRALERNLVRLYAMADSVGEIDAPRCKAEAGLLLAAFHSYSGRPAEAGRILRQTIAIVKPSLRQPVAETARLHLELSRLLQAQGSMFAAESVLTEGRRLFPQYVQTITQAKEEFLAIQFERLKLQIARGKLETATRTITELGDFAAYQPSGENPTARSDWLILCTQKAILEMQAGNHGMAIADFPSAELENAPLETRVQAYSLMLHAVMQETASHPASVSQFKHFQATLEERLGRDGQEVTELALLKGGRMTPACREALLSVRDARFELARLEGVLKADRKRYENQRRFMSQKGGDLAAMGVNLMMLRTDPPDPNLELKLEGARATYSRLKRIYEEQCH